MISLFIVETKDNKVQHCVCMLKVQLKSFYFQGHFMKHLVHFALHIHNAIYDII